MSPHCLGEPDFDAAFKRCNGLPSGESIRYFFQGNIAQLEGQYLLGTMYLFGNGVPQSFSNAEKWYLEAAKSGHVNAQQEIAKMHIEDKIPERGPKDAPKWAKMAAEQGDVLSQRIVGRMYLMEEEIETGILRCH